MIDFFNDLALPLPVDPLPSSWLEAIIQQEGKRLGQVVYVFCTEEKILEMNRTYLQHDYYTDIITFDYVRGERIAGDIYVCPDVIQHNASQLGTDPRAEFCRVLAHGILHLCGYPDKSPEEERIMREKEDYYLNQLNPNVSRETLT